MPELAIDIRHLLDGNLTAMVNDTRGQLPALTTRTEAAVRRERENGVAMIESVLSGIREGK